MLLQLHKIDKAYATGTHACPVLKELNLSLAAGEDIAIMGPSGSGKSTLLNIISGIVQADAGQVLIEGQDISHFKQKELDVYRRDQLGIVFQHHYLLPQCTALENVLIPSLTLPKAQRMQAVKRAESLMERAGVMNCRDRYPAQISGGESQRIAVCRALINSPKILLADEPTGALDHQHAVQLIALLKSMIAEEMSLILVTHWSEAAAQMSRQYQLLNGQLQ